MHEIGKTTLDVFQSTLPVKGATWLADRIDYKSVFQSTLPVKGATNMLAWSHSDLRISIHAPREGSDYFRSLKSLISKNFNPRSP